ncbi:MAG: hypothetical protein N2Z22_00980 [Turneriella sp.]|nr:hypothetical protein [Turneriella sp.]
MRIGCVATIILLSLPLQAEQPDIVRRLLSDSIATFSDAYDLVYYSLAGSFRQDLAEQAKHIILTQEVAAEKVQQFLSARGILLRRDGQPITRKEFAKILIERFDLPKGLFTRLLGSTSWYFRDAVRLGLFATGDKAEETMSTREMLAVFYRAEALHRGR